MASLEERDEFDMIAKKDRIGERFKTNEGYIVEIVEYNIAVDLWVEFQDEYKAKVHTTYNNCKKGEIKNPYHPCVYGSGMIGLMSDGSKPCTSINYKHTKEYVLWQGLIRRCYDEKYLEKHQTYKGVTICKRWLVFSNFLEDLPSIEGYEQWINNYDDTYELDKDLLQQDVPNNKKVYSPETCCFIHKRTNIQEMLQRRNCKITQLFKIYGINIKTGERTKVFDNVFDAGKELKINYMCIIGCIDGKYEQAYGYKW